MLNAIPNAIYDNFSTTTPPFPPISDPVTPDFGARIHHFEPLFTWYKQIKMETIMDPLHITTPLIESHALTKLTGFPVYLKLENVQPVGSFKIRGVGNLCQKV